MVRNNQKFKNLFNELYIPDSCLETAELLPELQDQSSLTNPTSGVTVRPCLGKENLIVKAAEIFLWTGCISTILHLCISAFGLMVSISFFSFF